MSNLPDQRSTVEQLQDTVLLAQERGMYDAADWIIKRLTEQTEAWYLNFIQHAEGCDWWQCKSCNRAVETSKRKTHVTYNEGMHVIQRKSCTCGLSRHLNE